MNHRTAVSFASGHHKGPPVLKTAALDENHPDARWNDQLGADQQDRRNPRIWAG